MWKLETDLHDKEEDQQQGLQTAAKVLQGIGFKRNLTVYVYSLERPQTILCSRTIFTSLRGSPILRKVTL